MSDPSQPVREQVRSKFFRLAEGYPLSLRIEGMEGRLMDELDELLGRLAHAPVHPALAAGEAKLLARASARAATAPRLGGRGIALAAAVATVMGIAGATVPATYAGPRSPLSPLRATDALAPSTLLGCDR